MRRSPRLTRYVWRLTALLHLFLASTVSIADARVERDAVSERAAAHVESSTQQDCTRTHQSDCVLCQHLTTPLAKAEKPAPPVACGNADLPVACTYAAHLVPAAQRPTLPRAPPSL